MWSVARAGLTTFTFSDVNQVMFDNLVRMVWHLLFISSSVKSVTSALSGRLRLRSDGTRSMIFLLWQEGEYKATLKSEFKLP